MGESIRVQVDRGVWETLGVDRQAAVTPEGIAPSWDTHGPSGLTFNLKRDPNVEHSDLAPFTPIDYMPDGERVTWSGYTVDGPAGEDGIAVSARGWQFALDDEPLSQAWMHSELEAWQDARAAPEATLSIKGTAAGSVQTDGAIVFGWPTGAIVDPGAPVGVILDLGADQAAHRVNIWYEKVGGTALAGVLGWRVKLLDTPDPTTFGYDIDTLDFTALGGAGSFRNVYQAVGAGRRYVFIGLHALDDVTLAEDNLVRLTAVRVISDRLQEAFDAGAAALRSSVVIESLPAHVPVLDQDVSGIEDTSLNLQHFMAADETPRQQIERLNGYHAWRYKVDERRRLTYRPQPSAPLLAVDLAKPGADWRDATTNSAEGLYNQVVVRGRSGSGRDLRVVRTIANLITRRGRTVSYTQDVGAPTDESMMEDIGDAFLEQHSTVPLKGTLTISSDTAVRLLADAAPVAVGDLGAYTTDLIMLENLIDPDTGELGRVGVLTSVSVSGGTATIAIDNERGNFAALLARMGGV